LDRKTSKPDSMALSRFLCAARSTGSCGSRGCVGLVGLRAARSCGSRGCSQVLESRCRYCVGVLWLFEVKVLGVGVFYWCAVGFCVEDVWGCIPLVRSLRVSCSRVMCSNIPMRCPQKVLRMRNKCTSVFHRAVRVRFVPHEHDFPEKPKRLLSFAPVCKRGQSCGRRSGRPRENCRSSWPSTSWSSASSVTRVRVIVRAFTIFVCPPEVSLRRTALAKAQRDDRLLLRIHGTEKETDREG